MEQQDPNKANYDLALKHFVRMFYDDTTIALVDFLCAFGGMFVKDISD